MPLATIVSVFAQSSTYTRCLNQLHRVKWMYDKIDGIKPDTRYKQVQQVRRRLWMYFVHVNICYSPYFKMVAFLILFEDIFVIMSWFELKKNRKKKIKQSAVSCSNTHFAWIHHFDVLNFNFEILCVIYFVSPYAIILNNNLAHFICHISIYHFKWSILKKIP